MGRIHLGGQAVLEGVMMRGRNYWVIAVRRPDNQIIVQERKINSLAHRFFFLNWPILRGIVALIDALTLGIQAINISAQEALGEEEDLSIKEIIFIFGFAIALVIGLFILFPTILARLFERHIASTVLLNFVEGFFRISIFVRYIFFISRLREIKRVFQYHGAEHKAIHAFEAGDELIPEASLKYSPLHIRCGTAFLLIVMVILIFIFSLLGRPPLPLRIISRLAVIPLVAGLSYEIIRLAARYENSLAVRVLLAPGLWLQRMTTREPSLEQLEVAISSLERLLQLEGIKGKEEIEASMA